MAKQAIYEELNDAIDQLMDNATPRAANDLAALIDIADAIRHMPAPEFRARLRNELEDHALFVTAGKKYQRVRQGSSVLQMPRLLFASATASYPVNRKNFVASFLLHAAALILMISSGAWLVKNQERVRIAQSESLIEQSEYVLTVSPKQSGGGGGGGDRDKLAAPHGRLPQSSREQFTPPAVVLRNDHPLLPVEPAVVAPPINIAANMPNLGDPMSKVLGPPSNGVGSGGGIGSGTGGGVGSGIGAGVGPGFGGGVGGGVYRVGGGVCAPKLLYGPDPDYTEEARKAKHQGTVVLWVIVGPEGRTRDVRVQRSLGLGLDEKAIAAVRQWKFEPAMKDGRPVSMQINVEVNFRMY